MKKIFNYILACATVATVFSACKPMDKTYSELGPTPPPVVKTVTPPTIASITLGATDYAMLPPSVPASTNYFFQGTSDAFANIPSILTKEYVGATANSQITVTYATSPVVPSLKLADSLYADVAYTPTTADYYSVTTKYTDFSTAQAITFLQKKYPTPVANQLVVLNYTYYESGVTTSNGTPNTIHSYLYLNGAWTRIYTISPAQYTSVGRGTYNEFVAADAPNLNSIFNSMLKADLQVMATVTTGEVVYVSFNYYASKDYQRVIPFVYNGVDWVTANTSATTLFILSSSGVWTGQLDNTVNYTLASTDYTKIAGVAGASPISLNATALTNFTKNSDFTLNGTSRWTDAQIAAALIVVLQANYTSPAANQKFLVTFKAYSQYATEIYTFVYDGTAKAFVYQPAADPKKYTITGDDYVAISADATTGATSAAQTNLASYGDFSTSWTQAQINTGIADVLKTRYTGAAAVPAGQVTAVTYAIYSGGNVIVTANFKFDGTNWTAQ